MPNRIHILSEDLANKIAAGEVIERPASVVKELVENALDAEARSIEVSIEGAGIKSIRITDDGHGMSKDDALNCLERHATSKIQSVEDLINIHTLGFRGEALPSIASVSRLEILTRPEDELSGTLVTIHGGRLKDVKEQGAPVGTTITVKNLFFNTPARRKFLKTIETEKRHISRAIMLAALSHPQVGFKFLHNNKEVFSLPPAPDLKARILTIFGKSTVDNLIPIQAQHPSVEVSGFIGRPYQSRKSRQDMLTFINGRPFYNASINRAIREGYSSAMAQGRFPFTILFLTINPRLVDVNVHPTKREVRFGQEKFINDFLISQISRTLRNPPYDPQERTDLSETPAETFQSRETGHHTPAPATVFPPSRPSADRFQARSKSEQQSIWELYQEYSPPREQVLPLRTAPPTQSSPRNDEPDVLTLGVKSGLDSDKPEKSIHLSQIMQVHNTYIITPVKSGFWVIDQHAAHERIVFEHARKVLKEGMAESQQLLFPLTLELTPDEYQVVEEFHAALEKLGFGLRLFGGMTVVLDAVPVTLKNSHEEQIFRDILDDLGRFGASSAKSNIDDHLIAVYACHTSVRAGQRLTPQEMSALIDALFATPQPFVCPHGRPIIIPITIEELEKRFGRIQ